MNRIQYKIMIIKQKISFDRVKIKKVICASMIGVMVVSSIPAVRQGGFVRADELSDAEEKKAEAEEKMADAKKETKEAVDKGVEKVSEGIEEVKEEIQETKEEVKEKIEDIKDEM